LAISAPATKAIFARFPLPGNLSSTDVKTLSVCPYASSCDAQTGAGYVTIPAFAFTTRIGPQDFGAGPPQNTVLGTGRLDWTPKPNTQAFLRYAIENKDEFALDYQPYSSELDQPLYGHNQNASASLIHTWSPRFVTETRLAYYRVTGDPDRFGGDAYSVPTPLLPSFDILNQDANLPGGSPGGFGPTNGYQFFQTGTYSRDRHTLRFGGQFVHLRQNYTFGIAGEVANAQFANLQGFVDGILEYYFIALNPKEQLPGEYVNPPFGPPSFTRHYHYNEPALFLADTWRITTRLVLTPGLRWEYFGVFHSPGAEHTLDSNFYPGSGSTLLEQIQSGQMMRTVDAPGEFRGRFYLPNYKNFAPRLGIAYDMTGDGKTVIRAGAGLFYDRWVGWELYRAYQNPPSYSVAFLSNIPMTPEIVNNQYAAFPNSPVLLTNSATQDPVLHMHTAYVASWNATIEKELATNFVIGASYLGSSGSRLYSGNNLNRVGSGGLLDSSCVTSRLAADGITVIGPDYTNCPRLNPNIATLQSRGNDGHSSYHALQLRIDSKSISRLGLEFGANYTLSHSIDNRSVSGLSDSIGGGNVGYVDAFAPSDDRGPSDFDVRHRFAAHFIWEIPATVGSNNWVGRLFLQSWEVSGFLTYQTGQPFSLEDLGTPDVTIERTRPRLTGALPRTSSIPDALSGNSYLYLPMNKVYDPLTGLCIPHAAPFACEISVNGPFQGTLPRNTFRQPGLFFWNAALIKNFPLPRGKTRLQFRAEFYNLLNHPNLYVKDSSTDVSTPSFTNSSGQFIPGVIANFRDNRQIVLAAKLFF
jgi:TonB dependent receptor